MLEINLLDWREEKQLRRQKIINCCLAAMMLLLSLLYGFLHRAMQRQLLQTTAQVQSLRQQVSKKQFQVNEVRMVEKQYANLISMHRYISTMHQNENFFKYLLVGMLNRIPSEANITYLKRKNGHYVILGQTPSTLSLSEWLNYFPPAKLAGMKQMPPTLSTFKIVINEYA